MKNGDHIKVADIIKPHGIKGFVKALFLFEPVHTDVLPDTFLMEDQATLLPYFLEAADEAIFPEVLLKFEGIEERTAAESLRGKAIYITPSELSEFFMTDSDVSDFQELVGFRFKDETSGKVGSILSVEVMAAQELFTLDIDGAEHLIPAHEDLIISIDEQSKMLIFTLPEGILDL